MTFSRATYILFYITSLLSMPIAMWRMLPLFNNPDWGTMFKTLFPVGFWILTASMIIDYYAKRYPNADAKKIFLRILPVAVILLTTALSVSFWCHPAIQSITLYSWLVCMYLLSTKTDELAKQNYVKTKARA